MDCPSQRIAATFTIRASSYYFLDSDGDGYGNAANSIIVCDGETPLASYISNFTDCDDGNSNDVMVDIDNHPVAIGMHEANAMISSEGMIAPGSDLVTFQAGTAIILESGFHAQAGSNFLAKIDSCGQLPSAVLPVEKATVRQAPSKVLPTSVQNPIKKIALKVFPNPFQQQTQIAFQLAQKEKISLAVYDNYGRLVQSYYRNEWQEAGDYQVTFNASEFSTGIFIVVLRTGNDIVSQRVVLIK